MKTSGGPAVKWIAVHKYNYYLYANNNLPLSVQENSRGKTKDCNLVVCVSNISIIVIVSIGTNIPLHMVLP